jgi:hypothetical protein
LIDVAVTPVSVVALDAVAAMSPSAATSAHATTINLRIDTPCEVTGRR